MANYWADKWIGLAGGGIGGALIGGLGVYQIYLYNMGGNPVPIQALVVGKKLGLVAHVEVAHAVCLMSGVKSEGEFNTISSSGFDWALDIGPLNVDAILKTGKTIFKTLVTAAAAGAANWATHKAAKDVVNFATGNLSYDLSKRAFYLIPTPVSLGLGAGVWYEWQTLHKTGTDLAWRFAPPVWKVESRGGNVFLRMKGIPERDNATIVFNIRLDTWGRDDRLNFAGNHRSSAFGIRESASNLRGTVHRGKLYEYGKGGRGQDGLNLTALKPIGKTDTGMFSVTTSKEIERNKILKIGLSVCKGTINLYHWESDKYLKVRTDAKGVIAGVVGSGLLWHK